MAAPFPGESQLRDMLKAALVEVPEERADLLRDVLAEVMEGIAFARAMQEGETSPTVSREEVFRLLGSGAFSPLPRAGSHRPCITSP